MNLFRNAQSSRSRHRRLLSVTRGERIHGDPPPSPEEAVLADDARQRVRRTIDRLPERERNLLLLHAEGYAYRDIAAALELNEHSVGTLLARARRAFRQSYEGPPDAR
jgi:RNA polymerase sigma factor (sigma-70 family)